MSCSTPSTTPKRRCTFSDHRGLPSLTLLDWHLRDQHGDVFLKNIRSDARRAAIPVVGFTTSDDASDLNAAYVNGANGYAVKPGTFDELVRFIRDLCS